MRVSENIKNLDLSSTWFQVSNNLVTWQSTSIDSNLPAWTHLPKIFPNKRIIPQIYFFHPHIQIQTGKFCVFHRAGYFAHSYSQGNQQFASQVVAWIRGENRTQEKVCGGGGEFFYSQYKDVCTKECSKKEKIWYVSYLNQLYDTIPFLLYGAAFHKKSEWAENFGKMGNGQQKREIFNS